MQRNMETRYYKVAEHGFSVTAEADCFGLMGNYEPFRSEDGELFTAPLALPDAGGKEGVFALTIEAGEGPAFTEELRQEDEGQTIICGKTADGAPVFEYHWMNQSAGWLVCTDNYREGRLILTGCHTKMAIDNALMVIFALATADKATALFHAAAVSLEGRSYMFLGKSGTGKSTHARLWLGHVGGTELMNDDNPVVRFIPSPTPSGPEGEMICYGSPWSGKTPCYRNVSYPLGGIVVLSQAPYNRIRRLGGIDAYMALMESISGKRWDARIADGLHQTENALVSGVPVWHLECLPDKEAATLCQTTITS